MLSRLRGAGGSPDIRALRERVLQGLQVFEQQARDTGLPMELLRPAHYALCASVDDLVMNTPWGAPSGWSGQTLVATFHPGVRGTDQFFGELSRMLKAPQKFLPVIELMYLCLALGFLGRYRQAPAEGELDRIRAAAYGAIAHHDREPDRELSRQWRGIEAPYRPGRRGLPVWVALAGSLAVCASLLLWTSASLNAASDRLLDRALAAPPTHMPQITRAAIVQPLPPPPAPAEPTGLDRLRASLQPDISRQSVVVLGTPATPIIRIADRGMFLPASATVQAGALPLLERVAAALRGERGPVRVIAYTDNQPIRSVQFPSNFQLSAARADAIRAVLARDIGDAARISAEGRADADPVAPNTTVQGREQNRRVEIVLHHQD